MQELDVPLLKPREYNLVDFVIKDSERVVFLVPMRMFEILFCFFDVPPVVDPLCGLDRTDRIGDQGETLRAAPCVSAGTPEQPR